MSVRLVAVLGYSRGKGDELHAVCAARLARAAEEATAADTVLLSGWSRRRSASEAELMARAWSGVAQRVLLDPGARSTYGNARSVARAAARLGATDVVLVTSGWHGRRAEALVRAALRGSGRTLRLVSTPERGSFANRLREVACRTLVPLQSAFAARRG